MITGHNTEIEHAGRLYHVQTEDKGRKNPVIETLIYAKGEIIEAIRTSYADLAGDPFDEMAVMRRVEWQHRRCLREIKSGRYDQEGMPRAAPAFDPAASESFLSANAPPVAVPYRTLDELILDVFAAAQSPAPGGAPEPGRKSGTRGASRSKHGLTLDLVNEVAFFEGTSVIVDLAAHLGNRPAGGASVRARMVASKGAKAVPLFQGRAGEDGRLTLVLEMPELPGSVKPLSSESAKAMDRDGEIRGELTEAVVVIQAEYDDSWAELRRSISRVQAHA